MRKMVEAFAADTVCTAEYKKKRNLKDPGSAITHLIGVIAGIIGMPVLLTYEHMRNAEGVIPMLIFSISLILLYGASTTYHSFDVSTSVNKVLRKIDHLMIYILIAGTYSPICLITLKGTQGWILFGIIWGMALLGVLQVTLWIQCPKWVSSAIYIMMGWACIFKLPVLWQVMERPAFMWLFAGGVIYTVGGVIYALKLKIFNSKHANFGSHEIFHLFCLGGSVCHFIMMFYI